MGTHTIQELRQMQSLPTEIKVKMTQRRIREWYEHFDGDVYVSFSGGKDSLVLKHITDQMFRDVPSVFVNTGMEYPEVQRLVYKIRNRENGGFNSDIQILYPRKKFRQVIEDYGYPVVSKEVAKDVYYARSGGGNGVHYKKLFGTLKTPDGSKSPYCCDNWNFLYYAPFKISDYCCNIMKKEPAKRYEKKTGRKPIIATMAEESRLRTNGWMRYGCNAFDNSRQTSKPLSFWTEQDILRYIKANNLPMASIYGDIIEVPEQISMFGENECKLELTGVKRTGCMFCMFGVHLEKHPNRFERMKTEHPKHYDYIMKPKDEGGCGIAEVLDYIGVEH